MCAIHKKRSNQTCMVEACLTILGQESSNVQNGRINIFIDRQDVREERMTPEAHAKAESKCPFQNRRRIKKIL